MASSSRRSKAKSPSRASRTSKSTARVRGSTGSHNSSSELSNELGRAAHYARDLFTKNVGAPIALYLGYVGAGSGVGNAFFGLFVLLLMRDAPLGIAGYFPIPIGVLAIAAGLVAIFVGRRAQLRSLELDRAVGGGPAKLAQILGMVGISAALVGMGLGVATVFIAPSEEEVRARFNEIVDQNRERFDREVEESRREFQQKQERLDQEAERDAEQPLLDQQQESDRFEQESEQRFQEFQERSRQECIEQFTGKVPDVESFCG